jgi:hypothetical protein
VRYVSRSQQSGDYQKSAYNEEYYYGKESKMNETVAVNEQRVADVMLCQAAMVQEHRRCGR